MQHYEETYSYFILKTPRAFISLDTSIKASIGLHDHFSVTNVQ